mmetsp:Transcript_7623/g.10851  ORF Transcript_7623/g.10851 Transcript_7623/m.10851 type:complete len:744 (-) Transcript_7623:86-2317(-)
MGKRQICLCMSSLILTSSSIWAGATGEQITSTAASAPIDFLEHHFEQVFGAVDSSSKQKKGAKSRRILKIQRKLEDYQQVNDDNTDDDDGGGGGNNDDDSTNAKCSQFLVSFLEGTTDAHDTCEGIMNAYTSAECSMTQNSYLDQYDYDDYFTDFTEHECCQALMAHHSDYCEDEKLLSNLHLFVAGTVLLLCECAKAVVNWAEIHFLPEAGVCILVGTFCGILANLFASLQQKNGNSGILDDMSFDDELFLSVLLPPIIFEAALSVSKYEFKRRRGAILMFSVMGTIISTFSTGLMVHYLSMLTSFTFPMLDSLVFGALISSIDPVAILSVLTSLNLDQKDTIFILVFGESLLNDGIAITVFQTLVDRFDGRTNDDTTSLDEIFDAMANFLISMVGSIFIGIVCGVGAWVYFYFLDKKLASTMEVGSFFLWALIPYYICDGIGWSGIVSIVTIGFFMDVYIAGPKSVKHDESIEAPNPNDYHKQHDNDDKVIPGLNDAKSFDSGLHSVRPFQGTERMHLSSTANKHVRFVAHLTSQLSENAIFAYLGLFLFSNNYDWDPLLVTIAIISCVLSRAIMVVVVSQAIQLIYRWRGKSPQNSDLSIISDSSRVSELNENGVRISRTAASIKDYRTQAVLVLAGLRGAVSFALVENVPIYNSVSGEGCEFKQLMKGMTSASIIFTTFIFGGGAYYILPHLGISPDTPKLQGGILMTTSSTRFESFRTNKPSPSQRSACDINHSGSFA